jgi:hypothetical protein
MTDFDPTDPWGQRSPWEIAQPDTNTAPEAPVTNQPTSAVENNDAVTLSFKGGSGYDASLLVLRAENIAALDRMMDQEVAHLKSVMEKAARVQAYSTSLNSGQAKPAASAPAAQPSFNPNSGQVQYNQAPTAPFGGGGESDQGVTTCAHGPRKYFAKDTWEAMFCQEREKRNQCPPAFKDKKTDKYVVKG